MWNPGFTEEVIIKGVILITGVTAAAAAVSSEETIAEGTGISAGGITSGEATGLGGAGLIEGEGGDTSEEISEEGFRFLRFMKNLNKVGIR